MSAYSAALTYHLLAVALTLTELIRYSPGSLGYTALQLPSRNLAIFGAAFLLRALIMRIPVHKERDRSVVLIDVLAFATIIGFLFAVAVPLDTSGAALFGIITAAAVGLPLVALTSAVSLWTARKPWVTVTLLAIAVVDLLALVLCTALQLVARP